MQKFEETINTLLDILQLEPSVKDPVIPRPLRATNGTKMEIGKYSIQTIRID